MRWKAFIIMVILSAGTVAQAQSWYNPNWYWRKQVTIDYTRVSAALTDYPVLVYRSADAELASRALASGADLVFTAADGTTKLSREIERFDADTGELVAWVQVPTLSNAEDTVIFLYYGNSGGTETDDSATWDSDYVYVHHMADFETTAIKDSTGHNFTGTKTAVAQPAQVEGKIGPCQYFHGAPDEVTLGNIEVLNGTNALTVEAWGQWTGQPNNAGNYSVEFQRKDSVFAFGVGWDGGTWNKAWFWINSPCTGWKNSGPGTTNVLNGAWHNMVGVYDGSAVRIYVDGTQQAASAMDSPCALSSTANSVYFGNYHEGVPEYWVGRMDEVRASTVARSAEWIRTQYSNLNDPTGFTTVAAEEWSGVYSPTPSLTPTTTPTTTPTDTATDTPTITPTDSPSATPSDTPTVTPTASPTDSPTVTPSITPTDTPSLTPTRTRNELGVRGAEWELLP